MGPEAEFKLRLAANVHEVKPGMFVEYQRFIDHGKLEEGLVMGYSPLCNDKSVVVVSDENGLGTPINVSHLLPIGDAPEGIFQAMTLLFKQMWPDALRKEKANAHH